MKTPTAVIDPRDPVNWQRPLWIVYGHECFPQLLCAKLSYADALNIWGYSVYKRQPGFRTLGRAFDGWAAQYAMCFVFGDQQHALDFLKFITAPKVKS